MAKRSSVLLGVGCLVLLVIGVLAVLVARKVASPGLSERTVVAIRFVGPVVEIKADDPFAELMGEKAISLRDLRDGLLLAAKDERVQGVRVRIDSFDGGFAAAQEIRDLLGKVSEAGKWTAAYLDTAGEFAPGNLQYFLASACKEISVNPLGDVNLIGLSARSPFIRGTFDKLGITAEFPGRGDYKTARFMYTEKDFTPAHREMMEWLLDAMMQQLVEGVAAGRGLEPIAVRALIDRGPFFGVEALQAGLVDRQEDWGAFTERLKQGEGGEVKVVSLASYLRKARKTGTGPKVAVVTAVGGILRGESRRDLNPLLGGEVMGSDTIAKAWRDVREDDDIRAAVFRIDSPGGSAVASEVIRQEMARTAEKIPVVVSMSNVAGSGGYWITCGAQRVVANPGTITGSIGVFAGHLNMDAFWREKLGVTFGRIDKGANANLYGDLEDWTDAQRAIADRALDRIYSDFVDRVSDSRKMSREAVDAVGRGRVFSGDQGLEKGLVDVVGGFDTALAEAKKLAVIGDDEDVRLVDFPRPVPWWQQLVKLGQEEEETALDVTATLEKWWRTGHASPPGVVWMPPIYVE